MKTVPVLLASLVAGAAAGFLAARATREAPVHDAAAAAPASTDALERLASEIAAQRQELEALRSQVALAASARARAESAPPAGAAAAPLEAGSAQPVAGAAQKAAASAADAFDRADALALLLTRTLDWDEREELFARARRAGELDTLLAELEAWAAARPEDPDAQVTLASAYIAKLQDVGQSPEAGRLALKADGAYDAALAVDERHWEARFAKAMSLSFWPPVFGKQTEAIKHFEILAQQQEGQPAQKHHAQTYLMLGNTYQQVGQLDKALAAWQKGLQVFPGDAQLAKQIENAKQAQGAH